MFIGPEVFCVVDVAADLGNQRVEVGVFGFVAQLVQKVHAQTAAVNVGVEIE